MHVVVSSTTWNLKGNLPRWSSKLQATRFSKDLICDTFFRIKVSPLYFRETKRTEEFVILEVSLWDQFGFKNGSWTIIWHNDTTLRCNYAPCNRQVHLNLRADLHLLVCLFPQWGCRLSFCSCTLKDRIVVVWTNFYWGRSATCNLEIVYTQQPKFACSELRLRHVLRQRWCRAALDWLHWTLVMSWYTWACAAKPPSMQRISWTSYLVCIVSYLLLIPHLP